MNPGFERLVDRYAIALETRNIAERFSDAAMANAEYLTQPRLKLLDQTRRVVRVQNAPPEARSRPPRTLAFLHFAGQPTRAHIEPVGKYHDQPNRRDLDYKVPRTAAGDDLIALLVDEAEPAVVMRRSSNGRTGLLATFDIT